VRLTAQERTAITECARRIFGDGCVVRLFGSRVDDRRRGGDIDLHVVADDRLATLPNEIAFKQAVQDRTEEQRIDVVLRGRSDPPGPIDEIAVASGVLLS
jgi:hypothetical protein